MYSKNLDEFYEGMFLDYLRKKGTQNWSLDEEEGMDFGKLQTHFLNFDFSRISAAKHSMLFQPRVGGGCPISEVFLVPYSLHTKKVTSEISVSRSSK